MNSAGEMSVRRPCMTMPVTALALLLFGRPSPAQTDEPEEIVDEIVVQAEMSPRQLRQEIRIAELQIFDIFNEINEDDDYDVICRRRAPIGSQIPRTECKARLFWDALSDHSENTDETIIIGQVIPNPQAHAAKLRELIRDAAIANPALLDALRKRRDLRTRLAEADNCLAVGSSAHDSARQAMCSLPLQAHHQRPESTLRAAELFDGRPRLVLEPGRAVVDSSTRLACTVIAKKETAEGDAVIVDAQQDPLRVHREPAVFLAGQHRFVAACQASGTEAASYRHVLVYGGGQLVAVASLSRMTVRLDMLAESRWGQALASRMA